jgi:hypothetical protein
MNESENEWVTELKNKLITEWNRMILAAKNNISMQRQVNVFASVVEPEP